MPEGKGPRILKWEGSVPVPPIPNTNFASFFLNVVAQYGEAAALVDAATGKRHTYGDIQHLVSRVRDGFAAAGVGVGDSVLLLTSNHIDAPVVLFSTMLRGAACVPVNPYLTAEELAHVIRVSGARWAVVHEEVLKVAEEAFSLVGSRVLRQLWVLGDVAGRASLADLIRTEIGDPPVAEAFDPATTVAMMPFSSGTTGLPKGVMLSHRNLMTAYLQSKYIRELNPPGSPNALQCTLMLLPTYHIYGHLFLMGCLSTGGKAVMLQKFSPEKYFEAIQNYKVTFSPIVPHIAKFLSETPLWQKYDLSSLMAFSSGSAPLPTSTMMNLMKRSGKGAGQGYGMTETCATVAVNGGAVGFKLNAAGKLLPYYECKVIDVKTGQMVGEGVEGEICLRGPSIMLGYVNNAQATSDTIDSEGWLHTGDLGYYDGDNFLYLTDRIKDLIKVKGYQVCPSELEKLLRDVEGVSDVAVVGVPSDRLGEAPRAYVVPAEGATLDPKELMKHVADKVLPYKQLSGGVEFVEVLPKNHMGKVLKRQLKNKFIKFQSKL
ncbi:probable 4-coumarate--CoA ligase 1 [Palaemon carinicauda]|uniref:probable 4-coumarate--CoA ligase 1 n=1 Tax=Palaemon carinicauda TaxID=392227 RepID=UPI0035B5CC0C